METIIVALIVAAAAWYLIRRFYNSLKKDSASSCTCGCDGCGQNHKDDCNEIENPIQ